MRVQFQLSSLVFAWTWIFFTIFYYHLQICLFLNSTLSLIHDGRVHNFMCWTRESLKKFPFLKSYLNAFFSFALHVPNLSRAIQMNQTRLTFTSFIFYGGSLITLVQPSKRLISHIMMRKLTFVAFEFWQYASSIVSTSSFSDPSECYFPFQLWFGGCKITWNTSRWSWVHLLVSCSLLLEEGQRSMQLSVILGFDTKI